MDGIGFQIERTLLEFLHTKPHDQVFRCGKSPATMHVPLGKVIWAHA